MVQWRDAADPLGDRRGGFATSGPIAVSRCAVTRAVGPEIETPPTGSPNSLKIAAATQRIPG